MNALYVKQMLYYRTGAFSRLELYASHNWGVIFQNMHGSSPFCVYFGRNLPTIARILVLYMPNDLATIGDVVSQLAACKLQLAFYVSKCIL